MLGELAWRIGRLDDAVALLRRSLDLAPAFNAARELLARILGAMNQLRAALDEAELLASREPSNASYAMFKASLLVRVGEHDEARRIHEGVIARYPRQPRTWMNLGHVLKTLGKRPEAIDAYRRAIDINPGLGEAWWSLANLKSALFDDADIAKMRAGLKTDISDEDRFHLHFALGKALEDEGRYGPSFEHYQQGNALRRERLTYDADDTTDHVQRAKALFTPEFFAARSGAGSPAPDPIFVVGLPRSGSTLVEQILSSHSEVEGTMELPDIASIARRIGGERGPADEPAYPGVLAELGPEQLRALGEEYLERTRIQRKTGRPLFIDKMPNNFAHLGLIHLILPNAKVVDVRRHPLACCFSGFKQHFARGQGFTYDLGDLGRYYADYVELMAHFDAVLPGRVHRVIYEQLVEDPEAEIRHLLDYCGLPFEAACLNFHQTARPVRTASSEQVRQPLYREGLDQWRNYQPWLGPLEAALGEALAAWPTPRGA
jgi:tetratricopeptide (TPR) repeat protein